MCVSVWVGVGVGVGGCGCAFVCVHVYVCVCEHGGCTHDNVAPTTIKTVDHRCHSKQLELLVF